jgi:hypothetical protein
MEITYTYEDPTFELSLMKSMSKSARFHWLMGALLVLHTLLSKERMYEYKEE